MLEPLKHAVGAWNFIEVSPQHMLGRFNGYLKAVVLRINEAKDMGEFDRFKFYDHMKGYLAAPPDTLRVDEKNLREHYIVNVCSVAMTTNYKTDGIYLPADDRRHFVAWSEAKQKDFPDKYWNELWQWYEREGFGHVAAYLAGLDLSGFDPKAPPPKTPAFWAIADANRAPEDAELADVLDTLEQPGAVTLDMLISRAPSGLEDWLRDRKNRRAIPHRLEQCGYVPVRNDAAESGLFVIIARAITTADGFDGTLTSEISRSSHLENKKPAPVAQRLGLDRAEADADRREDAGLGEGAKFIGDPRRSGRREGDRRLDRIGAAPDGGGADRSIRVVVREDDRVALVGREVSAGGVHDVAVAVGRCV
jgi:hypothetical protein